MNVEDKDPGDEEALEDLEPTESDTGEVKGGVSLNYSKIEIMD
jgi:hypothetical protein